MSKICIITLLVIQIIKVLNAEFIFDALLCSKNPMDIYRIDGLVNCNKEYTSIVEVKLYKRNMQRFTTKARALKVKKMTCRTKFYFFGSKNEDYFITTPKIDVTKFISLIKAGNCDTGKPLDDYELSDVPVCKYKWPTSDTYTVQKCIFSQGVVTTTHEGHMTSNLGNTLNCEYTAGFCITHDNVGILYEPDPTEQDDYVYVGIYNGTKLGTHLMIPNLGVSLKMPNISVGIHTTDDFKVDITRIFSPKLTAPNLGINPTELERLRAEINAKMSYILDLLANPIAETKVLCHATQMNNQLVRSLAQLDPTLLVRTMLKKDQIVASSAGQDYVIIYPCQNVTGVTWNKKANEQDCTLFIPVQYNVNNTVVNGYFDPITKVLSTKSRKISCDHEQDQYFTLKNRVFLHKPGHSPVEIPNKTVKTLPTFRANITDSMIELPDSWIYNESSKFNPSDLVWDYLNNRLDELENEQNDRYDHSERKRYAGLSFLGFLGISPAHIIDGLITFLTRIMAVLSFIGFIHVKCSLNRNTRYKRTRVSIS